MNIRKARLNEAEEILNIYKSLIGYEGCLWDEYYPSLNVVKNDISEDSLYVVTDNNLIIAVAHAGKDNELFKMECYKNKMNNPRDIARVAVKIEYQKQGIAKMLIKYIEEDFRKQGVDYIVLTAGKTNTKALKLYETLGYIICGEKEEFDILFYCHEKKL